MRETLCETIKTAKVLLRTANLQFSSASQFCQSSLCYNESLILAQDERWRHA